MAQWHMALCLCGEELVPGYLEIALLRSLNPRTGNGAIDRAQVLNLSIDHVADAFGFRFQVNGPVIVIEFGFRERNGVGARVDGAGNRFAVPVHLDHDLIPVRFARAPVTQPHAFQRMSLAVSSRLS